MVFEIIAIFSCDLLYLPTAISELVPGMDPNICCTNQTASFLINRYGFSYDDKNLISNCFAFLNFFFLTQKENENTQKADIKT
jgi:hypothetical protein